MKFKISTANFADDAVMVVRTVVDGEPTIMIVTRTGMDIRTSARMAAAQLTIAERDEYRRQCGKPSATEHPEFDVWDDGPVGKDTILPEHWVDVPGQQELASADATAGVGTNS